MAKAKKTKAPKTWYYYGMEGETYLDMCDSNIKSTLESAKERLLANMWGNAEDEDAVIIYRLVPHKRLSKPACVVEDLE